MHKYGRQILAGLNAVIYGLLAYHKIPITPELLMALTGPTVMYTGMKGKGVPTNGATQ